MQTTKIVLRSGENKITEYHNNSNTISEEEIQIAKCLRDTLEIHREEIRCRKIDKAVDEYNISNRIEVNRNKKVTLKGMLYDFLCSFELFDVLALIAWGIIWIVWWCKIRC